MVLLCFFVCLCVMAGDVYKKNVATFIIQYKRHYDYSEWSKRSEGTGVYNLKKYEPLEGNVFFAIVFLGAIVSHFQRVDYYLLLEVPSGGEWGRGLPCIGCRGHPLLCPRHPSLSAMSHIQAWQARSRVGRSDQKFQKGRSPKRTWLQLIWFLSFSELILTSRLCDFNSSVGFQVQAIHI